jgi:1,2-diacylglycerol 3-beta-galactosyltransferase
MSVALAEHLEGGGISVQVSELATNNSLRLLPRVYSCLVRRFPVAWALYYYGRELPVLSNINRAVVRRALRLHPMISGQGADLLIITQSIYCHLLPSLREMYTVVIPTDLFGGPDAWFALGANLYVVGSEQMRMRALKARIPASQVVVRRMPTGLPVADTVRDAPRSVPEILIIGGSEGVGPIRDVVTGLSQARCQPRITIACGHNGRLASSMRRHFPRVRILSFQPGLASKFGEYDLIVTKPGSLTLQEAADTGIPFLLMPGIPGIEAYNTHACRSYGIPFIYSRDSARMVLDELLDRAGRPLPGWRNLIAVLTTLREALPGRHFSFDDIGRTS